MAPLERAIDAAYDLGALGASDIAVPFYASRGWQPWRKAPVRARAEGGG